MNRKISGSLNVLSLSVLFTMTACASKEPVEPVLVEETYHGGTKISSQVVGQPSNQQVAKPVQQAVQKPVVQPAYQPTPKQEKRVAAEKADPNNYAQRRVVSVIPDDGTGSIYIKKNHQVKTPNNGIVNVVSRYGENHTVSISQDFPNMILTPFKTARAMGLESKDYDMGNNGKAIIIKPRLAKKLWISITDEDNPAGVPISLTLVPKKGLNSQTIVASVASGKAEAPKANSYPQSLSEILKAVANKKLPDGFVVRPLNHTFEMANGVSVKPVEGYSSNQYDIYRYRLTNHTGITQTLAEEMFANDSRIVAVSFYPKTILRHGEKTDVMIMVAKSGE